MREALNSALDEELARDKDVFIMGEEVSLCPSIPNTPTVCVACIGGRIQRSLQGEHHRLWWRSGVQSMFIVVVRSQLGY